MAKDKFYLGRKWNPVTGRTGRAVYFDLDEIPHMLLCGPPGCGKGATIEIMNLLGDNLRGCSVVSIDPSGQNKAVTARYRATFSDVVVLDPFGSEDAGCNPLLSVETLQDALGIAEALQDANSTHESFFPEGSRGLIAGAVLAEVREAKEQDRTPTLENVRSILTGDLVAFATHMVEHGGDFQIASLLRSFTLPDNRTIEAIKKTAEVATRWLLVEPIRSSLSVEKGKGVDWAKLKGPRPLSVYVILDAEKLIMFAPWLKLVTVSALNTLYRLARD
jgi:type IV secretion system protein VirD4